MRNLFVELGLLLLAGYLGYWLQKAHQAFNAILRFEASQSEREANFFMAMQSLEDSCGGASHGDAPRFTPHGSDPDRGSPIAGVSSPPFVPHADHRVLHSHIAFDHDRWVQAGQAVLRG